MTKLYLGKTSPKNPVSRRAQFLATQYIAHAQQGAGRPVDQVATHSKLTVNKKQLLSHRKPQHVVRLRGI